MPLKLTQKEAVEKFKNIHGDRYDYSKVQYIKNKIKVCIICKEHGEFWQTPDVHISGGGCPECARFKKNNKNQNDVIDSFIETHGSKYDYSKVKYTKSYEKVEIICPIHGSFWQNPTSHKKGLGCPKCIVRKSKELGKLTTEIFIKRSMEKHGSKYSYSLSEYKRINEKIIITCPIHGEFLQTPNNHIQGAGCPKCSHLIMTQEEWIKKVSEIHNNKYNYSKTKYVDSRTKVIITCPVHGDFEQLANSHMQGTGCEKCGIERSAEKQTLTLNEWIEKANKIHFNKYDYSKVEYKSWNGFITIICSTHGEFEQRAGSHLQGFGCPNCQDSKGEIRVRNWLLKFKFDFTSQHRFDNCRNINPLPFDFYLPELNWCIEYDGEGHYMEVKLWGGKENLSLVQKHDQIKTQYCKDNGIKLLRIPYWDIDRIEEILEFNFGIW